MHQLQALTVFTCDHRSGSVAVPSFPLSLRLVEEMLPEHGIVVS
jgi:hypothetical protein